MEATDKLTFVWALDSSSPYMAQVDEIIARFGWTPLNDATARVLCAVDENDTVVAFNVIQLFPFVGPLFTAPTYRGTGLTEDMADRTLEFLTSMNARGWLVIADNPHTVQLCESRGMKRVTSPVFLL